MDVPTKFYKKDFDNQSTTTECLCISTISEGFARFILNIPSDLQSDIKIPTFRRVNTHSTMNLDLNEVFIRLEYVCIKYFDEIKFCEHLPKALLNFHADMTQRYLSRLKYYQTRKK